MFFWRRRHRVPDEELSAYVDGQLELAARTRLEAHIEACSACREALEELRALRQALRELPRASAPHSFALREADVRPPEAPRPVGVLGRAPALLGGVATAAFLAFGVLVGVDVLGQPSGAGDPDARQEMLQSAGLAEEQAARSAPATVDANAVAPSGDAQELMDTEAGAREKSPPGVEALPSGIEPTVECPANADCAMFGSAPTPVPRAGAEAEGDGRTPLRAAEAATAAVALVAGGSLALVWWRRRA